ncbi:hypothetical protein ACJMK2_004757 [Sinanodonta woodiana]|uniref:Secreted protein n=1 Tax=Sinanodonta woodiana TaxID=1069815 RepID=A0ABD3VN27_SINWO
MLTRSSAGTGADSVLLLVVITRLLTSMAEILTPMILGIHPTIKGRETSFLHVEDGVVDCQPLPPYCYLLSRLWVQVLLFCKVVQQHVVCNLSLIKGA